VRIRFDKGPDGCAAWFDDGQELITARTPAEVGPAFAQMNDALARGKWLSGYATYELGYALEPRLQGLMPETRILPLVCFGVYDHPAAAAPLAAGHAALHSLAPRWDMATYARAFARLHDWIGTGDIYQANLTFPMEAQVSGASVALYAALSARQTVGHGALVLQQDLPDLLSRSPELFFRITQDGQIATRPMKGTLPRGATEAEDAELRARLATDPKIQAENLMIVDLLRNDISRLCKVGSVKVPDLFAVETYATVHQMTSLVTGQLSAGHKVGDVFQALFPCGSITGAPKLRAMEVIRALEPCPREAYCGAIGWFAPDGRADFNVAIRTLMVQNGRAVLNVGGGVVWDSTASAEYEEALWKARYATAFHTEPA
jgi:para-aminobenzoate synthetase component 1